MIEGYILVILSNLISGIPLLMLPAEPIQCIQTDSTNLGGYQPSVGYYTEHLFENNFRSYYSSECAHWRQIFLHGWWILFGGMVKSYPKSILMDEVRSIKHRDILNGQNYVWL